MTEPTRETRTPQNKASQDRSGTPRPKKAIVNGWVVLDKPFDMTSTQGVGKVKWALNANKAGHAGTLDPLATGVLPIALGEATKTVPYAQDAEKIYRFTVRWGAETTTDDTEGEVTATHDHRPDRAAIMALLPRFTGEILQKPPAFSAIKVNGERAYDLARAGEVVDLPPRVVEIDRLDLIEMPDADSAIFETTCGKGTYVRALARDMGRALGTYGHITALCRTAVGPFLLADAISLEKLEDFRHNRAAQGEDIPFLLPVETALDDIPALPVAGENAVRIKRGQSILLRGALGDLVSPNETGPAFTTERGVLTAIGEIEKGTFVPKRVFNL